MGPLLELQPGAARRALVPGERPSAAVKPPSYLRVDFESHGRGRLPG